MHEAHCVLSLRIQSFLMCCFGIDMTRCCQPLYLLSSVLSHSLSLPFFLPPFRPPFLHFVPTTLSLLPFSPLSNFFNSNPHPLPTLKHRLQTHLALDGVVATDLGQMVGSLSSDNELWLAMVLTRESVQNLTSGVSTLCMSTCCAYVYMIHVLYEIAANKIF